MFYHKQNYDVCDVSSYREKKKRFQHTHDSNTVQSITIFECLK